MLNDKTNKLLISKAGERHIKSAQWQCRVRVCVSVCVSVTVCVCVYRVASRFLPRSGVQARAQSNHSSVNILYYYNLGYAFNCACHKRLIHTHTGAHTHTTHTWTAVVATLPGAFLNVMLWKSRGKTEWGRRHKPFVSACICDGNVAEKCG